MLSKGREMTLAVYMSTVGDIKYMMEKNRYLLFNHLLLSTMVKIIWYIKDILNLIMSQQVVTIKADRIFKSLSNFGGISCLSNIILLIKFIQIDTSCFSVAQQFTKVDLVIFQEPFLIHGESL